MPPKARRQLRTRGLGRELRREGVVAQTLPRRLVWIASVSRPVDPTPRVTLERGSSLHSSADSSASTRRRRPIRPPRRRGHRRWRRSQSCSQGSWHSRNWTSAGSGSTRNRRAPPPQREPRAPARRRCSRSATETRRRIDTEERLINEASWSVPPAAGRRRAAGRLKRLEERGDGPDDARPRHLFASLAPADAVEASRRSRGCL